MHRIRYFVGVLTLVAAAAGAIWIFRLLKSLDDRPGLSLQVEFRETRGLRPGADVRYRGVTVGTVRSIAISPDGEKAVIQLLLEPVGAAHARVNSSFWIVTPRFGGLTGGASGLDTLVRDSYVAFETPPDGTSLLGPGSLIAGRERPPTAVEVEALEDVRHGDLLMTLLVPENHGLRPGSPVVFRGVQTGDVRSVELAAAGTHIEVQLRIARRYRQTVTDKSQFWVARPQLSGALFSGFTLTDATSLLSPFVAYYGEPGKGVLVQDGYRTAAAAARPSFEVSSVPAAALQPVSVPAMPVSDELVVVRITYAAIERDWFSPDDPILRHGSGVLFLDRSGRLVVATARSLVDGFFTERDLFGTLPQIADERIKVLLPNGLVLRAGRVWVDAEGHDLAALVLEEPPPDLAGTPAGRFSFRGAEAVAQGELQLRCAGPDGAALPPRPATGTGYPQDEALGAAAVAGDRVVGIWGRAAKGTAPAVVTLDRLPPDLRPQ